MWLGKGNFGKVFKGWVDENAYSPAVLDFGLPTAVKRLYRHKFPRLKEKLELEILEEFRHPNFVKVLGYCLEDKVLLLVYEFMQNGSLSRILSMKGTEPLPWVTRVKIALGVAQGLEFLYRTHGEDIDSQFFNTRNIMLDMDFNAKLSDFGVAKLVYGSLTNDSKDPMYFRYKPDYIYDFGVILLKILIQNSSREWPEKIRLLRSSRNICALDPRLKQDHTLEGELELASLVLRCLGRSNDKISIQEVLGTLKQIYAVMEKPEKSTMSTTHQPS